MWFVGTSKSMGHPHCLPWYISEELPPQKVPGRKHQLSSSSPIIRREEDIEAIRRSFTVIQSAKSLRLRPIPNLLRSKEFIDKVSCLAKEFNASVELEGSILSHAFYLLRDAGVNVICIDLFAPEFKKTKYEKLVRDKIPLNIQGHGEIVTCGQIEGDKLITVLKGKLIEESLELFWSDTPDNLKEEMVDIYEVLYAISNKQRIDSEELKSLADEKREQRGGFNEGYILKETKEFSLISTEPNEVGLFDDVESQMNIIINPKAIGFSPQKEGPKLVLPLIPPDPEHRHTSYPFEFEEYDISLNVRFREKTIVIEVKSMTKTKEQYNQLDLPFS